MMFKRNKKQALPPSTATAAASANQEQSKATNDLRLRQVSVLHELQALKRDLEALSQQAVAAQTAPQVRRRKKPKQPKQPKKKPSAAAEEEVLTPVDWVQELSEEERRKAADGDEGAIKFLELAFQEGFTTSEVKRCPDDYYEWTLEQRREFFGADSIDHLCKSLVVRNTRLPEDAPDVDPKDPTRCRYYMVIVQYVTQLSSDKLQMYFRKEHQARGGKKGRSAFNMRLCPADISLELTGYDHNAVTPLGSRQNLTVLMHKGVLKLPYVWLGGGEVSLKWKVGVKDLVVNYKPLVGDIADPNPNADSRQ